MSATALILLLVAGAIAFITVQTLQQNGMKVNSDPADEKNLIKKAMNDINHEFDNIMARVDKAFEENRLHDAESALENALKLQPHSEVALAKLAFVLEKQDDFDAAYGVYLKAIGLHSTSSSLQGAFASLLSKMGKYDDAKKAFMKAIELNPNNAYTYYNFSNMLVSLDEIEAAKQGYLKAIEIDKGFKEAQEALSKLSMEKLS